MSNGQNIICPKVSSPTEIRFSRQVFIFGEIFQKVFLSSKGSDFFAQYFFRQKQICTSGRSVFFEGCFGRTLDGRELRVRVRARVPLALSPERRILKVARTGAVVGVLDSSLSGLSSIPLPARKTSRWSSLTPCLKKPVLNVFTIYYLSLKTMHLIHVQHK